MIGIKGKLIAFAAATVAALAGQPFANAHSLDGLQQEMLSRDRYFQAVDRPAPDFVLADADGKTAGLSDFRGKVVVLNFIYASCAEVCPLHSEKIAEVQGMINITPMKNRVMFVTITTDPLRDTTEILRDYGAQHGLDPANWAFLTSGADQPENTTRKLAERFGHKFTVAGDGVQMHGVVTHVIDREGGWRANFHGLEFGSANLVLFVNALVNDVHRPAEGEETRSSPWEWLRALF